MRHRSDQAADSDSDLSISEDEDFDEGSSNYCVSLGGGNAQNHQEGIQVLFQLEKLRDTPKSVDGSATTSVSKSNIQSKSKAGQVEDNANTLRSGNNFQFNPSAKNNFPCGIGDEEIVSDDEDEDCAGLISSFNRGECPTSRCQKNEPTELASREFKGNVALVHPPGNEIPEAESCLNLISYSSSNINACLVPAIRLVRSEITIGEEAELEELFETNEIKELQKEKKGRIMKGHVLFIMHKKDFLDILSKGLQFAEVVNSAKRQSQLTRGINVTTDVLYLAKLQQLSATCFKSNEKKIISDDHQRDIEERCWSPFPTDVCDTSQKVPNLAEKSESFLAKNAEYPSADELEDFEQHGIQSVLMRSNMTTVPCGHVMQSFAECLDGLQDKTSLPREIHPGKKRKKISRGDIEREVVDSKFLNEVSLDPIGSESGSSGEESNYDDFRLHISHHDRSTMAERFQEILNSTSLANIDSLYSVQKPSSSGIFGQLQQVMQSQKDTDVEFLKMMRDGGYRGNIFGDVLILSKQLDAKLLVCQCSLKGNQGNPLSSEGAGAKSPTTRERTIVFSPRVCSSVDLEIGNLIRIYPPWLEVRVRGNNQNTILCTYYSQVSA